MILEREEGKRAIGIEQVRSATRFLQQTALYGERKILLVQEEKVGKSQMQHLATREAH